MAGRMIDDPAVRAARNRVFASLSRLDTARRRADSVTIGGPRPRTRVTAAFLARLSESKWASADLRTFATRVAVADTSWDRIDIDGRPVPPEVFGLRADQYVDWPVNWPLETDEGPYRIPWQ